MAQSQFQYRPPRGELQIHHADLHIVVVEKPAGLLSVPGKAADHGDCVETRIRAQFPTAKIVHRLDLDTSGLMVLALTAETHRHLSTQFERRVVSKRYVARVWGHPAANRGTIMLPLRCDWARRPRQMVDYALGKAAETRWEVIERFEKSTLVALYPRTGRSHQLRVHMAEIGHPILGDRFYAHGEALALSERMLLHAEKLAFMHPTRGEVMVFESAAFQGGLVVTTS
ncbi:MAG: pseudouridine synthase [Pseudomonadota bacterium]